MPARKTEQYTSQRAKTKAEEEAIFNEYIDVLLEHHRQYPRRLYADGSGRREMFLPSVLHKLTMDEIRSVLRANGAVRSMMSKAHGVFSLAKMIIYGDFGRCSICRFESVRGTVFEGVICTLPKHTLEEAPKSAYCSGHFCNEWQCSYRSRPAAQCPRTTVRDFNGLLRGLGIREAILVNRIFS